MKIKALALVLFAAFSIALSACQEEEVAPTNTAVDLSQLRDER